MEDRELKSKLWSPVEFCATREDNSEVTINVITHKGVKVERQKL